MGDKTSSIQTTATTATTTAATTTTTGLGSGTTTITSSANSTTNPLAPINQKNHYKSMMMNNWKSGTISGNDKTLNLLIVGSEHLASDLLNDVRMCTGTKGEYIYENQTYYLNYRIANGDMEAFKAIDVYSSGKKFILLNSVNQKRETYRRLSFSLPLERFNMRLLQSAILRNPEG